jgi:hypothetical protein
VRVVRVISGGQTGADQGGLFAAAKLGVPTGGWADAGWHTEGGAAPWLADYGLRQCPEPGYPARTRRNVADADAVVWFGDPQSPGARLTLGLCRILRKPHYVVSANSRPEDVAEFLRRASDGDVTLMVAGNRESMRPGVGGEAQEFVRVVLSHLMAGERVTEG